MLAFALNAVAGIERSESFCPSRTPEQPCTMNNVPVKHKYTLFSDGMPSSAVVVIQGTEFRSLNAQGDQSIETTELEAKDVVVKVGGGYLAKVSIDNANYQVNVKFKPFFIPTASVDAEKSSAYLLRMPAAYVKKTGDNLLFTTHALRPTSSSSLKRNKASTISTTRQPRATSTTFPPITAQA